MVVFVYSTHTLWPHHGETELEIMQQHLDKGDTVYRFVCNGELPVCDANVAHRLYPCLRCVDRQKIGQGLLGGHERIITNKIYEVGNFRTAKKYIFNYSNLKIFKELKIDNFDIGYAVSSSIISELRDPVPDITSHLGLFKKYFYSSLAIYFAALEQIEKFKPDAIYVFNGRVAHAKPLLRAAQKCGVECRIHERGCDLKHYGITINTTPHDISNFNVQLNKQWDEADPVEREKIGASFYEERRGGKEQAWISFTKDQQHNLLPEGWDDNKRNIGFFNTSEDEYESIGPEWKNELCENQAEGIERILKSFSGNDVFHFYLRIHPNLKGLNNKQIKDALSLSKYSNLTIILADSPVSTYHLMSSCEKIITFGSSTGIEAVYWEKVSILLGKSFYSNLKGTYKPRTHEEVDSFISSELPVLDKMDSLKYGYYLKTFGRKFIYFKATGFHSGTFKGFDLDKLSSRKTRMFKSLYSFNLFREMYKWSRGLVLSLQRFLLKW